MSCVKEACTECVDNLILILQLLEERDGLQLRLSNAIRTNEELRERLRQLLSSQPDDINISSTTNLQGAELNANVSEHINVPPSAYVQHVNPEGHHVDLQNKYVLCIFCICGLIQNASQHYLMSSQAH